MDFFCGTRGTSVFYRKVSRSFTCSFLDIDFCSDWKPVDAELTFLISFRPVGRYIYLYHKKGRKQTEEEEDMCSAFMWHLKIFQLVFDWENICFLKERRKRIKPFLLYSVFVFVLGFRVCICEFSVIREIFLCGRRISRVSMSAISFNQL